MPKYEGGHLWAAIRENISSHRERLVEAFDAQSYERESIILDDIARKIAAKIEPMVETFADINRKSE